MRLRCRFTGFLLSGAVFLFLLAGVGQAQVEIWASRYSGTSFDEVIAMALTPADEVVVTGYSYGPDSTADIVTVKIEPMTGETLWTRRYLAGPGMTDKANAIAVDDSGNIFVAGKTWNSPDTDFVVIKYLGDGTEDWAFRSGFPLADAANDIVPDGTGGAYIAGHGFGSGTADFMLVHLAAGDTTWVAYFDGPVLGADYATALAADSSGYLYVTGHTWIPATVFDYMTVKYDIAAADTAWVRTYDGSETQPAYEADYANGIVVDDSGNVYVTGRASELNRSYDGTTVKYAPDGTEVWVHRFDAGLFGEEGSGEIAIDADGYIYCAGYVCEYYPNSETDFLTYRIRPDGTTDWFQVANYIETDSITGLAIDQYSNVYVTGCSDGYEGDHDWLTVKYDAQGSHIWDVRHATLVTEDDWPNDIVVDRMGNVYVAGFDSYEGDEDYATLKYSEYDVGAGLIVQPVDTFRLDATVRPLVWIRNYSAIDSLTFPVRLEIGNFYFDSRNAVNVPAYDSVLVEFDGWPVRDSGTHLVRCYTMLPGDKEAPNDTSYGEVTGLPVWEFLTSLPEGPRGRDIKDGGALAFMPDTMLYAFKGNNTTEFYSYNLNSHTWTEKESIPAYGSTGRKKRVKRGARLALDTSNHIYALKGNNTYEFWRYDIAGDTAWTELIPYPTGKKKVKGGTGLEYVPSLNRVYSCKGSNTFEFYAYDVATETWLPMANVPSGPRNKKAKYGTCMAYDGDNTIYLLKGGKYEFYAYSISADVWVPLQDLRNSEHTTRRRKVKKGAGLAYDLEFDRVWATKGGKLTEFWFYDVATDSWVETPDTIPTPEGSRRMPYSGACLEYGDGKVYAFNGNKTLTFLRYNADLPLNPGATDGPQAAAAFLPAVRLRLAAVPNPFLGRTALRYSLSQPGHVRLAVYDVTGRCRRVLVDEWRGRGDHTVRLTDEGLAAGVYLAKLSVHGEVGSAVVTKKLLLAR